MNHAATSALRPALGLCLTLLVAGLLAAALPPAARAQTANEFAVNSALDQQDADVVDDICDADPGPGVRCTLRAAIMQANVTPGADTIRLQAQVYRLTIKGANDDLGQTGDLDIRQDVTIVGATAGRARSTIDATGLDDRVLDGIANNVNLQNLVIAGGSLPATTELGDDFKGGGIRNAGSMAISDSLIQNNSASSGGGVYHRSSSLTVARSTISNNRAIGPDTGSVADGGGGLLSNASLTVSDSTVQNNTSAFQGGGMTVLPGFFSSVRIERSLIVGNSAQAGGGGIMVEGINDGALTINNSTISNNRDAQVGGGIHARNQTVPVVLSASTIAGNSAPFAGGVFLNQIVATNVIFSNNTLFNCILGFPAEGTFNLSTDNSCSFDDFNTNLRNVSARLAPLQFNGGPTRTHALIEGSPAIDGGAFASLAILFDQRGGLRIPPGRFPAPLGNPHDIGAFELNALGVGTFAFNPANVSILPEQPTTLALTWTHPTNWRDLSAVDVQLRHEESTPLWVRFTEGVTNAHGLSVTNGLALYNSDGTLAGVGEPGQAIVLESDTATLDLAQSAVQGSGPDGKAVTLTLAVRLKPAAAGKRYGVTLLASEDTGTLQGPNEAGTLAVGPFSAFVPLVGR